MRRPELRILEVLGQPSSELANPSRTLAHHGPRDFERWIAATWVHNWQTKMIAGAPNAQKAIEWLSTRVDFVGWEDIRQQTAVASNTGTGPDIVLGWAEDPNVYTDKLIELSDVAEYLGETGVFVA